MLGGSSAFGETKVIPSISLSERYDSNAYISPREFVPAGKQPWDFVTTVAPRLQVRDKRRQADTIVDVGLTGNAFATNRDLSFISTNLGFSSDVSGWLGEYVPGLHLQVSDAFQYTPEPPAFVSGGKVLDSGDAFTRGIQASRANTYTNTSTVSTSYRWSRQLGLQGSYSYGLFRVGQVLTLEVPGSPILFFNTNLQNWSLGPSIRLARGDTINLNYKTTEMTLSGEGIKSNFTARGGEAEYLTGTQDWKVTISGGASVLEQGNLTFASGRFTLSTNYDASTKLRLTVSRGVAPAFFATGGVLISNSGGVWLERKLFKELRLTVSGNYAINESAPVKIAKFETMTGSLLLNYDITRTLSSSMSIEHNEFSFKTLGVESLAVARSVVMFSINTKWN